MGHSKFYLHKTEEFQELVNNINYKNIVTIKETYPHNNIQNITIKMKGV